MNIQWLNKQSKYKLLNHKALLSQVAETAWQSIPASTRGKLKDVVPEISLSFIGPRSMKKLNRESREVDQVTDVLSFPMHEFKEGRLSEKPGPGDLYPLDDTDTEGKGRQAIFLGDIVICPERAAEQAAEYGHSLERELGFLLTHGILHLCGYDHLDAAQEKRMRTMQRKILELAGLGRDPEAEDTALAAAPERLQTTKQTSMETQGKEMESEAFRSGFIAIIGRPNAGKSTLLNRLSGEHLAITSAKSQTTRHNIRYIHTDEEAQCIFVDTPGLHKPRHKLGQYMMEGVETAIRDCDLVLYLLDESKGGPAPFERSLIEQIREMGKPAILAINKIDLMPKEDLLPLIARTAELGFSAVVPVSAIDGDGVEELLRCIKAALPPGPLYYPPEDFTDQSERQLAAELIREKILRYTNQEIPHGTGVIINRFAERYAAAADSQASDELEGGTETEHERTSVAIQADILCERDSHKMILIGHKGQMLKRIGTEARKSIESLLGCKVHLELFVKVRPSWRDRMAILKDLGYGRDGNGRD